MNQELKILVLGRGDYFSCVNYFSSFVILPQGQKPILVDCPSPLRKIIYDASQRSGLPIDLTDIDDVILTHLHGDHCSGLEEFGFFKRFIQKKKPIVYTIADVKKDLWEGRLRGSMGLITDENGNSPRIQELEDYYDLRLLNESGLNTIGDVSFYIRRTRHYVPCFGFRMNYGNIAISYSADTTFDPKHIEFLQPADFIIHETNYGGHTPYQSLSSLPESIRRKMRLIHIPDDFNIANSNIEVLEEGKLYSITPVSSP